MEFDQNIVSKTVANLPMSCTCNRKMGVFKNGYKLLRALFKVQGCVRMISFNIWVRYPLKFHSKYLTHTLKLAYFI